MIPDKMLMRSNGAALSRGGKGETSVRMILNARSKKSAKSGICNRRTQDGSFAEDR